MIELSTLLGQLLDPERVFGMRGIVSIETIFPVDFCVLTDVFDVWGGFWCCCWSDHV